MYLGKELGGFRSGGYGAYMQSAEFGQGLNGLIAIAREGGGQLLCVLSGCRGDATGDLSPPNLRLGDSG